MTNKLRAVFDTSVVVSAVLLPRSVPRQVFDRVQEQGKVLISVAAVDELNEVLRRQHFGKYVREAQRLEFLAALIREAELVDVTEVVTECRDPKDNKFLELAVGGKANMHHQWGQGLTHSTSVSRYSGGCTPGFSAASVAGEDCLTHALH